MLCILITAPSGRNIKTMQWQNTVGLFQQMFQHHFFFFRLLKTESIWQEDIVAEDVAHILHTECGPGKFRYFTKWLHKGPDNTATVPLSEMCSNK